MREIARPRKWKYYPMPKTLAMAPLVEEAELLEPFQWLTADESQALRDDPGRLAELESELADVAIYLVRLADVLGVDLGEAIHGKMEVNAGRFPAVNIRASLEKKESEP